MNGTLTEWIARYQKNPAALAKAILDPVLWIEAHRAEADEDEPSSDDERSLHTSSGVSESPLVGEPMLLLIRKAKENAFQRGITVGRTPNNDLVIDDGSVSRFHAWFQKGPEGRWALVDAGSKNGTFVSVKKLTAKRPEALEGGEKLRFGDVDAWFLLPEKALERLKRRAT